MNRRCGVHAAFRYTWPGRDEAHICADCAQMLLGISNAMGLYVQLIPLSYRVGEPIKTDFPTCSQMLSKPDRRTVTASPWDRTERRKGEES